ncbi:MAG: tRNA 2-selenouridine(34) synthase MnmH [Bacteriovoracaceae bacterium]|nr:tRNA 2-selenouridine(34) synthase MnmH [Bacteriovoracaceae bacterium]
MLLADDQAGLEELFVNNHPIIDVRAPVEFKRGYTGNATNLPILSDEERHKIGLCYKQQGQEAAINLGRSLVSGDNKNKKVQAWLAFLSKHPKAHVLCFRGGLRSQISASWMKDAGPCAPFIPGGYKRLRQYLMKRLEEEVQNQNFLVLSGLTGSFKTNFLQDIQDTYNVIDLEGLANHRGSAFGHLLESQPTQINFENSLAIAMMKIAARSKSPYTLVENESRWIGRRILPQSFFLKKERSACYLLEVPFKQRVANIRNAYVKPLWNQLVEQGLDHHYFFEFVQKSFLRIKRKLGGVNFALGVELLQDAMDNFSSGKAVDFSLHDPWIALLLEKYYDPLYLKSMKNNTYVSSGSPDECREFLKTYRASRLVGHAVSHKSAGTK